MSVLGTRIKEQKRENWCKGSTQLYVMKLVDTDVHCPSWILWALAHTTSAAYTVPGAKTKGSLRTEEIIASKR
jgi:hypothetical protein